MLFAMDVKVNRIPRLSFLAAFCTVCCATWLAGCALHPGRGVKSCKYRFQTLTFTGMDTQQTHWTVDVAVTNPNAHEVTLTRMRYALLYQNDTLLSGWNPSQRMVAAGDSQVIRTTLDLPNAVWRKLPPGIWAQTDAQFVLVADAYLKTWVGDLVVPQAIKETMHVNMTEQVAKYRDMLMQRFFSWPGPHLNDGGIAAPDTSVPSPRAPGGDPGRDEPL
jgi:hypothetical protein